MTDQANISGNQQGAQQIVPEPMLYAVGGLMLFVLVFVGFAKLTGIGLAERAEFTVVRSISLNFSDEADGAVGVYHGETGERIHLYTAGEGGFVRTAMRALTYDRDKFGIGQAPPFQLTETSEGILLLEDPSTGRRVALEAFSAGNAANFQQLFDAGAAQ
ncbi:MAG: photosynthetic complex assembly protein PuhC [Pseudomonadota bacterium]